MSAQEAMTGLTVAYLAVFGFIRAVDYIRMWIR